MFAVIFSTILAKDASPADIEAYELMAQRMEALAREQPGFAGIESARNANGTGITVSYWETEADIASWKANQEHLIAQEQGRTQWYQSYTTRVAEITREYSHPSVDQD